MSLIKLETATDKARQHAIEALLQVERTRQELIVALKKEFDVDTPEDFQWPDEIGLELLRFFLGQ